MGIKVLTIKFVWLYLYSAGVSSIPAIAENTSGGRPPEMLFYFLVFGLFIPEIGLFIFSSFRDWIKSGLEDVDGKLNRSDMKDIIPFYTSYMIAKIVGLMSLSMIFYPAVEIPYSVFATLVLASFGINSIPLLKTIKLK